MRTTPILRRGERAGYGVIVQCEREGVRSGFSDGEAGAVKCGAGQFI